jgi:hypothetical protein
MYHRFLNLIFSAYSFSVLNHYSIALHFFFPNYTNDRNYGGWRAERQAESVQQATDADWLTRARDGRCAEPSKSPPPLSVVLTCVGVWRAERGRERERLVAQQATEADCVTTARDNRCAEPSKTRPPS